MGELYGYMKNVVKLFKKIKKLKKYKKVSEIYLNNLCEYDGCECSKKSS